MWMPKKQRLAEVWSAAAVTYKEKIAAAQESAAAPRNNGTDSLSGVASERQCWG